MWDGRDRERLEQLEQRVARLEAAAGLAPAGLEPAMEEPAVVESLPAEPQAPAHVPPPLPVQAMGETMPADSASTTPRDIRATVRRMAAVEPPAETVVTPAEAVVAPAVLPYAARVKAPAPAQGRLEQWIGLKGAGWVGAIVLVLGAAFGIKYGYDQGYFTGIPAAARVALMAVGGLALIGAGEWVYRRVNRLSAVGLYGAGVAVLFLMAYFGHAYYALYSREAALILMGAAMLIGSGVAMRGKMVSVAVLALLGGNIAPLVLHGETVDIAPFLSYLLMLQAVALVLAYWGASPKWWTLRTLSLVTTGLWMVAVIDGAGQTYAAAGAPLGFALIYAALYQLELILSARRGRRGEHAHEGEETLPPWPGTATAGVIFSTAVTALLTAALLWIFADATALLRGGWVLGLAGAAVVCGFVVPIIFGRKTRALGMGYRVQAAALVVVAVPVLWQGPWVVIGWGVLAVAFAVMGALLDLKISKVAGVITWLLAVGWGCWWWQDLATHQTAQAAWMTLGQTPLPAFLILGWLLTAAAHGIALLTPWRRGVVMDNSITKTDLPRLAWLVQGCGGLVFVAVSIAALPTLGATLVLVVYAWLLALGDLAAPRLMLVVQAGAVLALAMGKWVLVDLLAERLGPGWSASARPLVLNPLMGLGALIAASLVGIYFLRRRRVMMLMERVPGGDAAMAGVLLGAVVLALLTIGLSFEIDRVVEAARRAGALAWRPMQIKQLGWTMLWMVASGALLGLIVKLEPPGERRWRWLRGVSVLPLLLAGKYLAFDTLSFRGMGPPARVAVAGNLQGLAGLVVIAGLLLVWFLGRPSGERGATSTRRRVAGFVAVLVLLWMGTLEIDRYFTHYSLAANPPLARTVAFSIFWSLFAIACVISGFAARTAALRYLGLALFAVTLAKVVIFDMADVSTGYRILSFMALGLLLLITSVVYGRRMTQEAKT